MHPINQPKLIYSNSACAKIDCSTIDFSNVLSVVDGLCTACVGTNTEDCTLATCSDGYWMYLNGACNRIDCRMLYIAIWDPCNVYWGYGRHNQVHSVLYCGL